MASILGNDNFVVDQQSHLINNLKQQKYFSASYSDYDILVAIQDKPIGVDLERYNKLTTEKGSLFLSNSERIIMKEKFIEQTDIQGITMMWCFKESVGKLFGVGISNGINVFSFVGLEKRAKYVVYTYYSFMKDYCVAISSWNDLE